ncbi:MAG: hypothetical protein R2757_19825 [Draconibacterium sp.]
MSLSSWLKDYLYIPIGGNRNSSVFSYISLGVILAIIVLLAGKLILVPIFAGLFSSLLCLSGFFPA